MNIYKLYEYICHICDEVNECCHNTNIRCAVDHDAARILINAILCLRTPPHPHLCLSQHQDWKRAKFGK